MLQVSDLSEKDRAVNAGAVFLPAEPGGEPDAPYVPPRILLAGVWASVYARDGVAVLEVETEDADPEVFDMIDSGGTAAPALAVNLGKGRPLLATTHDGEMSYAPRHAKAGA
jgi:hypothetical protein